MQLQFPIIIEKIDNIYFLGGIKMMYSNIINEKKGPFRVGVLLIDDNKNVALYKHIDKNIGKEILEIPFIELNEYNERDIINSMYKSYGVKIDKINGYINESNFLDKNCNSITQINIVAKVKNCGILKENLMNVNETYNINAITNNAKQVLDIFQYNYIN